jgi:hypothetical protein
MLLGHVIGGLACSAARSWPRRRRVVLGRNRRAPPRGVVRGMIAEHDFTEHDTTEHNSQVFQLDRDDYTYIR